MLAETSALGTSRKEFGRLKWRDGMSWPGMETIPTPSEWGLGSTCRSIVNDITAGKLYKADCRFKGTTIQHQQPPVVYCVDSLGFIPELAIKDTATHEKALQAVLENDFEAAIKTWFAIPEDDRFQYMANISVQLKQVQHIINLGVANGLHAWYWSQAGDLIPPPPQPDIAAYISIFLPQTATVSSLKSFASNARESSIRQLVAAHLTSKRFIHPNHPLTAQLAAIPKTEAAPCNPYLDFWSWSCRALEWCGPGPLLPLSTTPTSTPDSPSSKDEKQTPTTITTTMPAKRSHHILPILMHHFGCATSAPAPPTGPSCSGSAYWTFMLRAYNVPVVVPIDNNQSAWRVTWVRDTVIADGVRWLNNHHAKHKNNLKDLILLLVYPIVGGTSESGQEEEEEGAFTRNLLAAYRGDTVAVVGTQNHNGYTGFRDVVQVPLPSFAGKDGALFVFQRRKGSGGGGGGGGGGGVDDNNKAKKGR
ncbi:hypothetical protein B0T17DRAFT_588642 [Bombardia bombarda]|uniref:Uncharacterized protein n=1 Tax=Bombardia bombarda TaxID=252184 RepID=A0AA39X760_9PEZI|nr:hypothetical protein B0T17DRAFT_588642 [Bombardia bombarda]